MALQSTIDRINDAVVALGQAKDLLLRGNADRPNSDDVLAAETRLRIVARAMDAISIEYDADEICFVDAVSDAGFHRAADRADERLSERRPRSFAEPECN